MWNFLMMLIVCSVTMSMIAVFLIAAFPFLQKKYSSKWLYYAWIITFIGFVIPVRPRIDFNFKNDMSNAYNFFDNVPIFDQLIKSGGEMKNAPSALLSIDFIVAIWLIGFSSVIIIQILRHVHFIKMVNRWKEEDADKQAVDIAKMLTAEMGINQKITVQVCPCVSSPMMVGFLNPSILLPAHSYTDDELTIILKHELVHYLRKDLWIKGLVLLATSIHWFNPIIYLAARDIDSLCELSCDEEILHGANQNTRQLYSDIIIALVRHRKGGAHACSPHRTMEWLLTDLVKRDIQKQSERILRDEDAVVEELMRRRNASDSSRRADCERQLRSTKQRLTELDRLITKSYEEMVAGEIPRDILLNLLEKYQSEKRETAKLADELTLRLTESEESEQDIRKWIDLMKRNMAVEEIDRNLLMRLIDKIIVGQKREENGVDYQNITILYNLVGAVE